MATFGHYIRQGMSDLDLLIPTFWWWIAIYFVAPIAFVIFLFLRHRPSYPKVWPTLLLVFAAGCLVIWSHVYATPLWTPRPSSNPGGPSVDMTWIGFVFFLIVYPIIAASYPLIVLVAFTPPPATNWKLRVGAGITAVVFITILVTSMFGKAAANRDSYLKYHPEAAKYRLVK